jgi:hypothetical protein
MAIFVAAVMIALAGAAIVLAEGDSYSYTYIYDPENVSVSSDETTVYTEDAYIDTETTNIYAETYVESGLFLSPSYTILYSLNNILNTTTANTDNTPVLFKPRLDDLPGLKEQISQSNGFAVVYDGFFNQNNQLGDALRLDADYMFVDPNSKRRIDNPDVMRALELMGYDMFVYEDRLTDEDGRELRSIRNIPPHELLIEQKLMPLDSVAFTKKLAIMAIYKALGKSMINAQLVFMANTQLVAKDKHIKMDDLPLATEITVPIEGFNHTRGFCYVYLTRSSKDRYWERAVKENVLLPEDADNNDLITAAEFCYYLQRVLYHYGEPVLTEQEENYLLAAYGRYLPAGVDAKYLNAIKYLVAKGIVLPDELDFHGNIRFDDMLVILMRAADPGSRQTFKEIQITYDESFIAQGYFPTEVSLPKDMYIEEAQDYSAAAYFDYFIEVDDGYQDFSGKDNDPTIKKDPARRDMYIADSSAATTGISGSKYLGVEYLANVYFYHFQAPTIETSRIYIKNHGYDGSSNTLSIEFGGGYYFSNTYYKRQAFLPTDDISYIDKDRKGASQRILVASQQLAPGSSSVILYINSSLISKTTFDGEPLRDAIAKNENIAEGESRGGYESVFFSRLGTAKEIQDRLVVDTEGNMTAGAELYQAYITLGDSDNMFVSLEYLKDCGLLQDSVELEEGVLLVHGATQTIVLDKNRHRIVSGNVITDTSAKSQLWTKSMGQIFIDYRAVVGWTSKYFLIEDSGGSVSITPRYRPTEGAKTTNLKSPFDEDLQIVHIDKQRRIILNGTDPLSPYVLYRDQTKGVNQSTDTLYSFKARHEAYANPTPTNTVEKNLGFQLPDDLWVLERALSPISNDANPVGIEYTADGYVYEPAKKSKFTTDIHYGVGSDLPASAYIPYFVSENPGSNNIINFNMNVAYDISTGKSYPYGQIPQYLIKKGTRSNELRDAKTFNGTGQVVERDLTGLRAAPVAMWFYGTSIPHITVEKANSQSVAVYFGTMRADVAAGVFPLNRKPSLLLYSSNRLDTTTVVEFDTFDTVAFRTVLWQNTGSMVVYDGYDVQPVDMTELEKAKNRPGTKDGGLKSYFDFENFTFLSFLRGIDDAITISVIFIINMLPRFFMFLFIVLMCLACIARVPVWKKFCASVFDPYKVITAGRQTCETIDLVPLFLCSIAALALFGIFQNGLILDLVGWIVRAVTGILSR